MEAVSWALAGGAAGILAGLLGVGGGFVLVPLLTVAGLSIHEAVGTSIAYVVVVASVAGAAHLRQRSADPVVALPLVIAGVVAAPVGAAVADRLDARTLSLVFGVALVSVAFVFRRADATGAASSTVVPGGRRIRRRTCGAREHVYGVLWERLLVIGGVAGLAAGLLGIGGGFLLVPLLALWARVPLPVAIGTSMVAIVPPAAVALGAQLSLGHVRADVAVTAAVPGVLASVAGARLSVRIPEHALRLAFTCVLVVSALKLLTTAVA